MSNSPLISGTLRSPNNSGARKYKITRITPHYMAGLLSAKQCCEIFLPTSRQASSNYCIGKDGEIWLCVDEANRAWTSGSYDNDNRAVTIECANYNDGSLPSATWNSLVKLCADICKRNGITKCTYTGNTNGVLTMHKWFQATDCPGPWLSNQFDRLATETQKIIDGGTPTPTPTFGGTYRCTVSALNVRTSPSTNSQVVAQYHKGDTVVLDNWQTSNEGFIWGRYTGASSGQLRYVAVGRDTGKVEADDYLVKV